MPFINSGGIRIWYEVVGRGRPLVLLHGGAADGSAWRESGYVDRLQSEFQLILLDQRGAGRSDKPHEADAYLVDRKVADTISVVDDLGIGSFVVWGWSWGGDPALELARLIPDRVEATVLTGNVPGQWSAEGLQWNEDHLVTPVRARGMEAILELALEMEGDDLPDWTREQIMETDPAAFVATAIGHSRHAGPSAEDLAALSVPVLIIVGEHEDTAGRADSQARLIPDGSAAVLPGLNHVAAFDRSYLTVPIFRRFVEQPRKSRTRRPVLAH